MKIVIPSYKRAGRAGIISFIPESYHNKTYLFVRPEEVELYKEAYPTVNVITCDGVMDGIAETRQRIVETFIGEKIWMVDDDLRLFKSFIVKTKGGNNEVATKHHITEEEFYEFIDRMNLLLETYHWGSVHQKKFPLQNMNHYPLKINSFNRSNYFYDLAAIKLEDIKFNDVTFAEDMYHWLELRTKGYQFAVMTDFIIRVGKKSNAAGGCSTYRDITKQNEDILKIHHKYGWCTRLHTQKWNLNIPNPNNEEEFTITLYGYKIEKAIKKRAEALIF